ncbi:MULTISPECIES: hypothetical protein [Salinibaculum]|uniref:hypothetical protein n=1 Tax=Salinibaculum TaxID=2732368 RepID=UPI0030D55410
MPDCDYCGDHFADEEAYLDHLADAHEGELGAIDRRRVDDRVGSGEADGVPTGPLVLGGVLLFAVAVVAYVLLGTGGGSGGAAVNGIAVAQTPGAVTGSAHGHGFANVTIAGERVDFSRPEYQRPREFAAFHFEGGDGRVWHKHADGVTLEYAMATLDIGVTADSVTFQGTTYSDSDPGTNVSVTVDGESVDPASYELSGASDENPSAGDRIRIVVQTEA